MEETKHRKVKSLAHGHSAHKKLIQLELRQPDPQFSELGSGSISHMLSYGIVIIYVICLIDNFWVIQKAFHVIKYVSNMLYTVSLR